MINKRLLIKNLLAHSSENSFYDKKLKLNLNQREGKAKLLKHICAMANANPHNTSYIVVGVDDQNNQLVGVDFYDDSKIQNLINAYLKHPPFVIYENIPFAHLKRGKVIGLISIKAQKDKVCSFKRSIWKYKKTSVFIREGSISKPQHEIKSIVDNKDVLESIEKQAQNNIKLTLDGVFDFYESNNLYNPNYLVFREYFVLCWAGKKKVNNRGTFYSRVNIELINEQVKLFYSDLDEVTIAHDEQGFKITEFVHLGLNKNYRYYPLEEVHIVFSPNMTYTINRKMLFEPPQYDQSNLIHILNSQYELIKKIKAQDKLTLTEQENLKRLPVTALLCYFNQLPQAIDQLEAIRLLLKENYPDIYARYKDSMRILRKVNYSNT